MVLAGACDLVSRDEMTSILQEAVRTSASVVVDLAAVHFLDSSGLHALITAYQAARHRSGTLHVVNATGSVATVLEITGVKELLQPPSSAVGSASPRPGPSS